MAVVDFSHAVIEPVGVVSTTGAGYVIGTTSIKDANDNTIATPQNVGTSLVNKQKQRMYGFSGTFTASGTEFYIMTTFSSGVLQRGWRISNITFQAGDTFNFQVNASLICN